MHALAPLAVLMYLSLPMTADRSGLMLGPLAVREFPVCSAFQTKGETDKSVILMDDVGVGQKLIGPWKDYLFADLETCKAKAHGQKARIQKTGIRSYHIISEEAH